MNPAPPISDPVETNIAAYADSARKRRREEFALRIMCAHMQGRAVPQPADEASIARQYADALLRELDK